MVDRQIILIHLDRNRVWLFKPTGELLYLDLPTTIMKDMEILNHELFLKQFESFLSVHAIQSHHAYVTVAEALLFTKDFSGMEPGKQDEAVKLFIENVPFDNVAKTTVHLDKTTRVIAANKDEILLVKSALTRQKCEVPLALPISVFTSVSTQGGVTPQTCAQIVAAADNLKEHNLFDPPPIMSPLQSITENAADKKHPKRLPVLLGAFGGLIAILVGVVVVTNSQPTIAPSQAETLAPLPTRAPSTTVAASPSAALKTLKIDIVRGATPSSTSAKMSAALQTAGITDLREVQDQVGAQGAVGQVTFSQTIPSSVQDQVMAIVRTVDPSVTVRVVSGLQRDAELRPR